MTNEPNETSLHEQLVEQYHLQYTTPENLVADFVSRGLVALALESLGIPTGVHERINALAKQARLEKKRITDKPSRDRYCVSDLDLMSSILQLSITRTKPSVRYSYIAEDSSGRPNLFQ